MELHEAFDSDEGQDGQNPSDRLKFTLTGSDDGAEVQAYARATVPATYNGRSLQDVNRTRMGSGFWMIEASYASNQFTPTGEKTFTFSTGGGSQQITHAINHVKTYSKNSAGATVSNVPSPFDGWLNPGKGSEVNGTTIDTGAFEFQVGLYISPSDMTAAYVALLYRLTNTVNATAFTATVQGVPFTFQPGEGRLKGANGSLRGYGDWELTLNFAAQPNITNRTIGGITGIEAKRWDHISVVNSEKVEDAGDKSFTAPQTEFVLIDKVYYDDNWVGLLI